MKYGGNLWQASFWEAWPYAPTLDAIFRFLRHPKLNGIAVAEPLGIIKILNGII